MSSDAQSGETVVVAGVPLYVATPPEPPAGGVIVVQEAFGVTSHIRDVAQRFAAAGYLAVAPHLFHRSGDPQIAYDDIASVRPHMDAITPEGLLADLDAALQQLADSGLASRRCAAVGFCMGGTVALVAGVERPLGAAVSFYGGGVRAGRFGFPPLLELAPRLQSPWLGLYGGQDGGIPVEDAEALRDAAANAPVPTDLVLYPNGQHGFHCDDRPNNYDEASSKDAWSRTLTFLEAELSG
jgi:carboxymethylenebutenolidase